MMQKNKTGKVYLVGAGPGDPGLVTLRAKQLIEQADVIVYDYLSAGSLLEWSQPEVETIYVGKKGNEHTKEQFEINQILLSQAAQGKQVVRLKGGDPFVYGRGGEEADFLFRNKVEFEIVPGITSALSVPAYAGIPITHRELASSFAIITGHHQDGKLSEEVQVPEADTLVYLMGIKNLKNIVQSILKKKSEETPIAIIQWGTTNRQKTLVSTLKNIIKDFEASGLSSPAIIVVGSVVLLRDRLSWFEKSPLFGQQVVITRARKQASKLRKALESLGAVVNEYPTIEIKPLWDSPTFTASIQNLEKYHWIIFTSVNAVEVFFEKVKQLGMDARIFHKNKIGVIGPATQEKLNQYGLAADFCPTQFIAEAIVEEFPENPRGLKILLPRASLARELLPDVFQSKGAEVTSIPIYETLPTSKKDLVWDQVDWITFTSSSTADHFIQIEKKLAPHVKVASIGPITTETLQKHQITPTVEATEHTIPGLVQSIVKQLQA